MNRSQSRPRAALFFLSPLTGVGRRVYSPSRERKPLFPFTPASKTPLADQYLAGMEVGWNQSLDRLAEFSQTGRIAG